MLIAFVSIGGAIVGSSGASAIVGGIWRELRRQGIVPFAAVAAASFLAGMTTIRAGKRLNQRMASAAVGTVVLVSLGLAAMTASRLNGEGVWRTAMPGNQSFAELARSSPERHISTYWAAILSATELLSDAEIVLPPGTAFDKLWRAFAADMLLIDPTHDSALLRSDYADIEPRLFEHPLGELGTLVIVGNGEVYRYYTTAEGIMLIGDG